MSPCDGSLLVTAGPHRSFCHGSLANSAVDLPLGFVGIAAQDDITDGAAAPGKKARPRQNSTQSCMVLASGGNGPSLPGATATMACLNFLPLQRQESDGPSALS